MPGPTELLLEDVRCFPGVQRARLRPITLLVGENSTGKTTFLGCYGALHRMLEAPVGAPPFDFDLEPFSMGSFRDIVRSRRGRAGSIREFRIGFGMPAEADGITRPYRVVAAFRAEGPQPAPVSWRYEFGSEGFLEFRRGAEGGTTVAIEGHRTDADLFFAPATLPFLASEAGRALGMRYPGIRPITEFVRGLMKPTGRRRGAAPDRRPPGLPLVPVAPLRAKPKRTYDPVRETAAADGAHIPMFLMRLDHSERAAWTELRGDLAAFGRASGLFSDIRVKRRGKLISDPFQLQAKARSGSHVNLVDAGYGVSQCLPILVDLLASGGSGRSSRPVHPPSVFLLQQPEAHLHPRGQAELGTLFANSVRNRKHRFLIKTHSDYLVDRIRVSARKGTIGADDVSILYFEPRKNAVEIHSLRLDEYGNLLGAPAGYRDFFRRETDLALGFGDRARDRESGPPGRPGRRGEPETGRQREAVVGGESR